MSCIITGTVVWWLAWSTCHLCDLGWSPEGVVPTIVVVLAVLVCRCRCCHARYIHKLHETARGRCAPALLHLFQCPLRRRTRPFPSSHQISQEHFDTTQLDVVLCISRRLRMHDETACVPLDTRATHAQDQTPARAST